MIAPASIAVALAAVMGDVQAVGKDQQNAQQGYNFRGVDAVVNAAGPALRKHGVVVMPTVEDVTYREVEVGKNRTIQRECTLRVRFDFVGPAGDFMTAVVCAEALDSGDKATAKAHSVAFRTCLLQVLAIPTHDLDPDAASPERAKAAKPDDAPAPRTGPSLASQQQINKIFATANEREVAKDVVRRLVYAKWRDTDGHLSRLTKQAAHEFIDKLTKWTDEELDAAVAKVVEIRLPEEPAVTS